MDAPAYQVIKDFVLACIHSGEWAEGDQVPTEYELAGAFKVGRLTVNRALRELKAERVITRMRGAGSFVARPKYDSTLVAIRGISEEISARGQAYRAQLLGLELVTADEALAEEMQLAARAKLWRSQLLHFENDQPMQFEERWVNPAVAPEYAEQSFATTTPNQYLMRVAPLQRVEYRIEAALPAPEHRKRLRMGDFEPCLLLHRRTWSRGVVASVVNLWHPGSRYRFTGAF
ncbi:MULTISPECIES: histidine utilization repressor [unclassified Burkholderia]|uniref:histidine utilization repressor n=1 Tax=unclassified Burkholderia TaxID=2613784 RepID=UPI002ABE7607|nr:MULTISPECIES: histidine utilization repressor [unclassified Burkholderia]